MVEYLFHEDVGFPKNWEEELRKVTDKINSNPITLTEHMKDEDHQTKLKRLNFTNILNRIMSHDIQLRYEAIFEYKVVKFGDTFKIIKVVYRFPKDIGVVIGVRDSESKIVTILNPKSNQGFKNVNYDSPDEMNRYLNEQGWMSQTSKIAKRIQEAFKLFIK